MIDIDNEIHTCSYYCEKPKCIKAQRDELRLELREEGAPSAFWIGIEKSVPFSGQFVITFSDIVSFCQYVDGRFYHGLLTVKNVTHWQPLPKPPEGMR